MKSRIYLEKLLPQDFESFYALTGNEKVMAMITERPLSKEEALKKFNYFLEDNKLHKSFGSFKVFEVEDSGVLGFGNEIAEILLEVAISDLNLTRVYANTDPNNHASRKILINNGFTSEEINELDGLPNEVFGRQLHS